MTNLKNALSTLRDSMSGADLAALREATAEAVASDTLEQFAANVAAAHPATTDYPDEYSGAEWMAALRALAGLGT